MIMITTRTETTTIIIITIILISEKEFTYKRILPVSISSRDAVYSSPKNNTRTMRSIKTS